MNRDKHRFVIGQGGKTINQIRNDANVKVTGSFKRSFFVCCFEAEFFSFFLFTVPKPEENEDAITLEGTMDGIDKAIKMIQAATSGPAPKKGGSGSGSGAPRGGNVRRAKKNRKNFVFF